MREMQKRPVPQLSRPMSVLRHLRQNAYHGLNPSGNPSGVKTVWCGLRRGRFGAMSAYRQGLAVGRGNRRWAEKAKVTEELALTPPIDYRAPCMSTGLPRLPRWVNVYFRQRWWHRCSRGGVFDERKRPRVVLRWPSVIYTETPTATAHLPVCRRSKRLP